MSDTSSITSYGTKPPAPVEQYLRSCSLIVGNASGSTLDLSSLRVEFRVTHASVQTPRTLTARIYNVWKDTASKVQQEFTTVVLSVGYGGSVSKLFSGQIRQSKYGRETPTDTYLDIIAADGDEAYSKGYINQTIAAGWTWPDVARAVVKAAASTGLTMGTLPPDTGKGARPNVLLGPIRDVCRNIGLSTGSTFSIVNNTLNFTPISGRSALTVKAVVLRPDTGLVGIPRQTIDGVEATCLINPRILAGTYVQIDTTLIAQAQVGVGYSDINGGNLTGDGSQQSIAGLSASGTYRVVYVDHYGDTRGNDWYSTVSCFADDANAKMSDANLTAVP